MSFQQIFQNISRSAMPTFLGIGAPRAGTTWLWENLRKHPDIWTPRTKEVHFFDRRLENRVLPLVPYELEAKLRYIYFFLKGNILGKVTGEITPAYSILPQEKIRLIHSWIPKAKIFYVMRDPVLRAWSQARKDFFRLTGKRLDTALKDDIIDFFKLPQIEVRADYLACLENWTNLHDSNQFFIAFTGEISSDPINVLRNAFQYLNVNSNIDINWPELYKPLNVGLNVKMPPWVKDYLSNILYKNNDRLKLLIARDLPWE